MNLPFIGGKEKAPKIALGVPPIADLMPPRSRESREVRELKRKWIFWGIIAIIIVIGLCFASFGLKVAAQAGLNSEKDNQASLTNEIARYDEVDKTLNGIRTLEGHRATALITDAEWVETFNRIDTVLPPGSRITGFTASAGGSPQATEAVGLSVLATVTSSQPIGYSDVLKAFTNIEGVTDVQVGDLTREGEDGYTYTVAFGFDNSIFTNRFNPNPPAAESEGN